MKKALRIILGFVPAIVAIGVQLVVSIFAMIVLLMIETRTSGEDVYGIIESVQTKMISGNTGIIVMILCYALSIVVAGLAYYFIFARKHPSRVESTLTAKGVLLMIPIGIGLQIAVSMMLVLAEPVFPLTFEHYEELMSTLQLGEGILPVVLVSILAPISEELFFRGLTIRILKPALPLFWVNLIQALLFGLYHMNIIQGIYAFGMGMILGSIAIHFDSIYLTIILHAVVNFSGSFLNYVLPEQLYGTIPAQVMVAIVGLAMISVTLYFVMKIPGEGDKSFQVFWPKEEKE